MKKPAFVFGSTFVGVALLIGCNGGVQHPAEPGRPNNAAYCANRPPLENNCMACSAQPGCGWCDEPEEGRASCQPGTSAQKPGSCSSGWAFSSEECTAPPPPPAPTPPV